MGLTLGMLMINILSYICESRIFKLIHHEDPKKQDAKKKDSKKKADKK